jgi:hypothetical protein
VGNVQAAKGIRWSAWGRIAVPKYPKAGDWQGEAKKAPGAARGRDPLEPVIDGARQMARQEMPHSRMP